MKLDILNTSIVTQGQYHNPSVLHPSFLVSEKIVSKDWELLEPPVCTPPLSIVKYKSGFIFFVEPGKCQITDDNPPVDIKSSLNPIIAIKYLKKLPYVKYLATGINITGFIECSDHEKVIIERFLTKGAWNSGIFPPQSLGLKFIYPIGNVLLQLTYDAVEIENVEIGGKRKGIMVKANYHTHFITSDVLKEAEEAIGFFPKWYEHFNKTILEIFNLED